MSTTKSLVSILFGIMRGRKWLNEDQSASDHVPNWDKGLRSQVKLRHLLECTAGFPYLEINNNKRVGLQKEKPINAYVEGLSPKYEPGKFCIYSDEGVQLLGSIMSRCCAQTWNKPTRIC